MVEFGAILRNVVIRSEAPEHGLVAHRLEVHGLQPGGRTDLLYRRRVRGLPIFPWEEASQGKVILQPARRVREAILLTFWQAPHQMGNLPTPVGLYEADPQTTQSNDQAKDPDSMIMRRRRAVPAPGLPAASIQGAMGLAPVVVNVKELGDAAETAVVTSSAETQQPRH